LPRQPLRERRGDGQMATIYKNVVSEAELFEPLQTTEKRRTQQKAIVRLALRDVAAADQLRMTAERLEIARHIRRLQIHPSDNAGDERMGIGQGQEPARFVERLARLDGDARLDAGTPEQRLEIVRQEVAAQRRHAVVDPSVLKRVVAPEMLVRVNARH